MAKFRKKPVVIDAWRVSDLLHDARSNWKGLPEPIRDAYETGDVIFADAIHITTFEGTMLGEPTDWVICGVKGELYPCKPDIFAATYEPAE